MRIPLGLSALKEGEKHPPVYWDSDTAVNGHFALFGMTGSGKTFTLRRIISAMRRNPSTPDFRVHVFDVHGDLDVGDSSTVMFSEQTDYGLNPLVVNPDRHFGGVRKRINYFIKTVGSVGQKLGVKQEATLRCLLEDLYTSMGFDANDPRTWHADLDGDPAPIPAEDGNLYLQIPFEDKEAAKECANIYFNRERNQWFIKPDEYRGAITRWQPVFEGRRYPSVRDALLFSERIYRTNYLGISHDAVMHLQQFNLRMRSFKKTMSSIMREKKRGASVDDKMESLKEEIDKCKEKAVSSIKSYLDSVESGREMDTVLKYDSLEVLKSVVNRLASLNAVGVFKSTQPPFDPMSPVWRYHLKSLSRDEQKLFITFKLEQIFLAAVEKGESPHIREVVVVDEAARFFEDDPDNAFNVIANEARKFGLALICASQSPHHFSDDFMGAVGCKILLGIDEQYYDSTIRRMRLTEKALSWIVLTKRLLVQVKEKGSAKNAWQWIYVPQQGSK